MNKLFTRLPAPKLRIERIIEGLLNALLPVSLFLSRNTRAPRHLRQTILPREQIDRSEEKYRTLIEQASDTILISDTDGHILETNHSAWKMFGYDKDELDAMNISELYSPTELRERPFQYQELFNKKVVRTERTIVCKDGSQVPVEVTVKRLSDGRFMAILRDISERKRAEDQLKAAVGKYELVAQATSDTIWDWDLIRNTKTYNSGIRDVFGYDVHEVQDADQWIIDKIHPEDIEQVRESFLHVVENRKQNLQLEYRVRCANGTYKHVYDRSFVIYGPDNQPARLIGAMQDITKSKEEEKRIATAIIDAQEKERLHLGQELHDNVNQILACALLTLDATDEYYPDAGKMATLINSTRQNLDLAINEIRRLSHQLAPAHIEDARMNDIIEELLNRINVQGKYNIRFESDPDIDLLTDECIIINLYRITQEQLKNIVKHADAKHIAVTLAIRHDTISLSIDDDGRGFDSRTEAKGIGLNNIRKRVESLSGKFTLRTAPGKGCTIITEFPMSNRMPQ
ncbi:MAG TPA: PAS domain S-box protein [Puia sp.]|uniref:PAS domain-containing sensor histidine kinase n=1 Tax=Puia sp. TaxID=2045100 RepID=UPI002C304B5B|nr:PAS domain S-box protein [Puia sp.]HVU94408.1 PAS domain S-box protein [Puia sp.]